MLKTKIMKNSILILSFLVLNCVGYSQDIPIGCGSDINYEKHLKNHPEAIEDRKILEEFTENFVNNYDPYERTGTKIIPVVFHVNDPSNPEKVTMGQIESALQILNEDFSATNADISDIRPEFVGLIADVEVQFCLASIDPDGNPTTGVTYHYNSYNGREPDGYGSAVKGVSYWPGDQYLNIWIVNYVEDDGSLYNSGWAYLPDDWVADNELDGIVYNHRYLGYEGSSEVSGPESWQAEMARVLTHEVGHYLNLHHTFYNYCTPPGDYVDDTPYVYYHGSNNCEQLGTFCSTTSVVMDQNYMDYTPCPSMYSLGQKARVQAALNSSIAGRNNLWKESNLVLTGCMIDETGIQEENRWALEVYPNPATTEIYLNFGFSIENASVKISNMMGQLMISENIQAPTELYSIDLSSLEKGVYIVTAGYDGALRSQIITIR